MHSPLLTGASMTIKERRLTLLGGQTDQRPAARLSGGDRGGPQHVTQVAPARRNPGEGARLGGPWRQRERLTMRTHWLIPETPFDSYLDYLEQTGPSAVLEARTRGPDGVLSELERSGLRGRGGAGFPTAQKWRAIRDHQCSVHAVVCNAAEGEPGTFKDRWILRHNPYAVLEGMLIAAQVIGTRKLYLVTKAAYTRELSRLRQAIAEFDYHGLLDGYTLEVIEGPDHYLLGEERALLEVIEGGDPLPRDADTPPYEVGLFASPGSPNPALVNNVETLARVPSIVRSGGATFAALGTADTPGPLIFTVSGAVRRPGMFEVEAGISLRVLLVDFAGGPLPGHYLKAVLPGFASRVLTEADLDTPADFGSFREIGASLGAAGLMALDEGTSIPRVTQAVARFLYVESCNQCSACKFGLGQASRALDEICGVFGGTAVEVSDTLRGARMAPQGNRCSLPVQGATLIPSLIELFPSELGEELGRRDKATQPWPVPKIVDYHEALRRFTFDTYWSNKRPDWSRAPHSDPAPSQHNAPAEASVGSISSGSHVVVPPPETTSPQTTTKNGALT